MIQQHQLRHHHDNDNTNHSQTMTLKSSSILQKQEQYSGGYSALSPFQELSLLRRSNINDNNYHQNDEKIMAIKSCLCSKPLMANKNENYTTPVIAELSNRTRNNDSSNSKSQQKMNQEDNYTQHHQQ